MYKRQGIKKYQWVTLPLAIHGVIALKAGRSIEVCVGEDPSDPVFCISDLLPHLGQKQMEKNAKEVIDAEDLDVIVGSRPLLFEKDKDVYKRQVLGRTGIHLSA